LNYELAAPVSTPEDQAYPMKLTIFADGGYSNTVQFNVPVGCGIDCDVESGTVQQEVPHTMAACWSMGDAGPG